jgi:hypothetical protein
MTLVLAATAAKKTDMSDSTTMSPIKDRVRKREAIKGPRAGDWVIMADGSFARLTLNGIYKTSNGWRRFATDNRSLFPNHSRNFWLSEDGRIGYSGGNQFHDVSHDAKLVDTGQTKSGTFCASKMGVPILPTGFDFELPCRVYRLEER